MKQFVVYRRVSTVEQGRSGLGLDAQGRDIEIFLDSYVDCPHEVIGRFFDVQSGVDNNRPGLIEAMQMCRDTGAELLVSKLDRLSRRASFIANILDEEEVKVRVASMPSADTFQLLIYAALAEQERRFISLRTKAALAPLKGTGRLGGLRDKTEERNKAVQHVANVFAESLRHIVVPLRANGSTLSQIADALDKANIETPRNGKWTSMQVKRVLDRLAL